jgi:hypothetical protein
MLRAGGSKLMEEEDDTGELERASEKAGAITGAFVNVTSGMVPS